MGVMVKVRRWEGDERRGIVYDSWVVMEGWRIG